MDFSNWDPNYERRKRKRDHEFEQSWLSETMAEIERQKKIVDSEVEELRKAQQQRKDSFMRMRNGRYQKLKGLRELGDAQEKRDEQEVNKLRKALYSLMNWNKQRQTIEPDPDKPGYVKITITASDDNEIEWNEKELGPRPRPD